LFQTHFPGIVFFSSKKEILKKNIKKKKMQRREGSYFQALALPLTFGFYLWPPISAILFQTLSPWHFLFLKQKKKKKTILKKNAKKGGSLLSSSCSTLSLLAFASGLIGLPFHFKHFLLSIFLFSSKKK
jgi:hypothetical protein